MSDFRLGQILAAFSELEAAILGKQWQKAKTILCRIDIMQRWRGSR